VGNSAKRDAAAAQQAEKQAEALALRRAGLSYREIADRLGYHDCSGARKLVQTAIAEIIEEPAKEVLALEIQRLDAMVAAMWPGAVEARDPEMLDRVLKIMDRRAKYLGLDAPKKTEMSGPDGGPIEMTSLSDEDVDRKLAEVERMIAQRNRVEPNEQA
jgi:transcriptional regulator